MYPIVRREKLADNIILMDIKAPRVAKECLPGQFIIAKTDEVGERIPLTICDYDREKETVTIVVQTIGAGTERMMALNEGDSLEDFVGPLGCPSELCQEENLEETKKKHIVFIAGGLGTAPVYPQVKWLKEHGVDADVIMGFRNKDILFYEDEMKAVAKNLYVCTDDGSYGFHGNGSQQRAGYKRADILQTTARSSLDSGSGGVFGHKKASYCFNGRRFVQNGLSNKKETAVQFQFAIADAK